VEHLPERAENSLESRESVTGTCKPQAARQGEQRNTQELEGDQEIRSTHKKSVFHCADVELLNSGAPGAQKYKRVKKQRGKLINA